MISFTHSIKDLIDDQWILNPDKFSPNMIVNGCHEHYGDGMLENLAELATGSIIYSHDPKDDNKLPNLKFYPFYYYRSKDWFKKTYQQNISNDRKTYDFSCLNMSAHPHRIINWLLIKDMPNSLITFHNDEKFNGNNIDLTIEEQQLWAQLKENLPGRQDFPEMDDTSDPAYTDSYINLVTETTVCDKVFISEKTWKPIASGQLFLILGNPGTIDHLRSIGIDCFDDIIDHSYDSVADPRERMCKVRQSLDKLVKEDLFTINLSTKQRRTRNAELYWSDIYEL